ncbi:MAG: PstS family phosphate ABC transporter substrate-binding protein [Anaerolineales bacterium]
MEKQTALFLISVLALSLLLNGCGSPSSTSPDANSTGDDLNGTISVSGAFALYPMMTIWADEFHQLHPNVQFDVQGGGAGKGITDTIAGAVDIGMISRSIKPEEEAQGIFWISVAKDAVFPIISTENPVIDQILAQGFTQEIFNKIYITGEITTWGEVVGDSTVTDKINVFTRSDAAGAAVQWATYSGGEAQEDLVGVGVNGEPAMVEVIIKDPLGLGFGNLNSIFDLNSGELIPGILVPPIDLNQNGQVDPDELYTVKEDAFGAVANGIYPSPPSRFENLATLGKPQGVTLVFLEWVLTDGQQFLETAGYVPLTVEQQTEALEKLQ